jgi:hypothetical protein
MRHADSSAKFVRPSQLAVHRSPWSAEPWTGQQRHNDVKIWRNLYSKSFFLYLASKPINLNIRNKRHVNLHFILLIKKLHGGQPFLRSWQLLSDSGWRFNTRYIQVIHYFLSWASLIQYTSSHLISFNFILMLSSYLHIHLTIGFVPSGFSYRNFVQISTYSDPCEL